MQTYDFDLVIIGSGAGGGTWRTPWPRRGAAFS